MLCIAGTDAYQKHAKVRGLRQKHVSGPRNDDCATKPPAAHHLLIRQPPVAASTRQHLACSMIIAFIDK